MKLRYLSFDQERTVRAWWRALQPRDVKEAPESGPFVMLGRGDRAKLRRCPEPEALMLEPAFHRLAFHLDRTEAGKEADRFAGDHSAYALVAGVLAHVEMDAANGASFAGLLGQAPKEKDKAPMSELRFQRLQTCGDEADFYRQVIRAVKLLDGCADVVTLADDLLAWIWECRKGHVLQQPKDRLKFRWASDYYRAALKLSVKDN